MSALAIGQLAASLTAPLLGPSKKHNERPERRTEQPVHRGSFDVDDPRAQPWMWGRFANGTKKGGKRYLSTWLSLLEDYDRLERQAGRPEPFGPYVRHIARTLVMKFADFVSGKLIPSHAAIATKANVHIDTVRDALSRLKEVGFLDWVRRTEKIPGAEGKRGPQVRQTSCAYRINPKRLPLWAWNKLRALFSKGGPEDSPPPADEEWRREEAAAEHELMLASLPPGEQGSARCENPELAAVIDRCGAAWERNATRREPVNP